MPSAPSIGAGGATESQLRRACRRSLIAFAGVAIPVAALSMLVAQSPIGMFGPVAGPWAGMLVGHRDCTMGTQLPIPSIGLAIAAVPVWLGANLPRSAGIRGVMLGLLVLWTLGWSGAGLMSLLNAST